MIVYIYDFELLHYTLKIGHWRILSVFKWDMFEVFLKKWTSSRQLTSCMILLHIQSKYVISLNGVFRCLHVDYSAAIGGGGGGGGGGLQLHLHSRLASMIGQRQLHGETRNIYVLRFGVLYIRDLWVPLLYLCSEIIKNICDFVSPKRFCKG